VRIGIICPSEIAFRRFLPSLSELSDLRFIGIAIANVDEWFGVTKSEIADKVIQDTINGERSKAGMFLENYGGEIFDSYTQLINSDKIDAVYLPLPPALHYKWAKLALLSGKHVLIEKPATTSKRDTQELILHAKQRRLAIHENYMFTFHDQLKEIKRHVESGEIGDVRLYRISFGFPRRAVNDFRYNKELGGGAILDCGGYTIKYASMLLGETAKLTYAQSNYLEGFDVDLYGSAALVNESGTTVQVAFGMDNSYRCDLEIWGSKGYLTTGRVLTAPSGFVPEVIIKTESQCITRKLPVDDAFKKSIQRFQDCIGNDKMRENNYADILKQADLIDDFVTKCNKR